MIGGLVGDKVDELANQVDDALVSAEELENDPGHVKEKSIHTVKDALEKARDTVDEMEEDAKD
jgi:hypothetical protein